MTGAAIVPEKWTWCTHHRIVAARAGSGVVVVARDRG
jgi:hypothetical protein